MSTQAILVIDDDEAIRKSFTLALKGTEYGVDTAESGELGLERFKERRHDLIFLDLKMPGLNGVDTLREIRKIDSDVHVYIVTAFHKEFLDSLKVVVAEGIEFQLLQKPIGGQQIVELAGSILHRANGNVTPVHQVGRND